MFVLKPLFRGQKGLFKVRRNPLHNPHKMNRELSKRYNVNSPSIPVGFHITYFNLNSDFFRTTYNILCQNFATKGASYRKGQLFSLFPMCEQRRIKFKDDCSCSRHLSWRPQFRTYHSASFEFHNKCINPISQAQPSTYFLYLDCCDPVILRLIP